MTLPEFLLARLDEIEAVARPHADQLAKWAAAHGDDWDWSFGEYDAEERAVKGAEYDAEMGPGPVYADVVTADLVCADVEAKRRIVELFPSGPEGDGWDEAGWRVMCLLARPYVGHPDYQQDWAA